MIYFYLKNSVYNKKKHDFIKTIKTSLIRKWILDRKNTFSSR
jgi:hypothetical protein